MLPSPVKAHFLGEEDILFQTLRARRRQIRFLPIALVENELLIQGNVIEEDLILFRAYFAEGEIRVHLVHRFAV